MKRIVQASSFAAEKHGTQRRKDAEQTPYINHPLAVSELLATVGGVSDEDILVAALLHDTVEDTDTTASEIIERFGKAVADYVMEVTDDKSLAKAERKRLQVVHASQISDGAKQIKLADKINNLEAILSSPPLGWSAERKREYFDWANDVFRGLKGVNPALDARFAEVYSLYE